MDVTLQPVTPDETREERRRRKARERKRAQRAREARIRAELAEVTPPEPSTPEPVTPADGPRVPEPGERARSGSDGRIGAVVIGAFDAQGRGAEVIVFDRGQPGERSHAQRYADWLDEHDAERELGLKPTTVTVRCATATTAYDPLDLDEVNRALRMIQDDPDIRRLGIPESRLRETLANARPGLTLNLVVE